jgi:hypothetical protein
MFETLNEAGAHTAGLPDGSSPSVLNEGPEMPDLSPFDSAAEPGLDTPDYSVPRAAGQLNETPVANGVDPDAVDFEADDNPEDTPFHNHPRWKELMGRKKALEDQLANVQGFAPVVERLKSIGINSAEEFDAAYAAEEQRQFEANLAQALNAGVRNGTIPPATAQAQFESAVKQRQIDQAMAAWQGFEINQQIQAAKQRFPEMDDEMVRQVAFANYGRPGFDLAELARRSHERNLSYLERHLAQYEADRAQTPSAPLSNERGSLAPTNGRMAARRSWEELLGLTKFVKT